MPQPRSPGGYRPVPPIGTLTVGELTLHIRDTLEGSFSNVWVEAELGAVTLAASGHVYLTLKDEQARLDAVIWRSTARSLRHKPDIGQRVLALGRISVYPPRGSYQFIIERLEAAGVGALQAAFHALQARLADEGLFDDARKKSLPFLPRAVGVVTGATGAARRDIEAVLHRRSPQVPIVLYPALVQGQGAATDIEHGLRSLDARPDVDVIIVGRGGGSLEDLWAFNEETVARAIVACRTPVVSAVGHETDVTIADFVADLRAPTPSAAAEAVVPVRDDLLYQIDGLSQALNRAVSQLVHRRREHLGHMTERLRQCLRVDNRRLVVSERAARLDRAVERQMTESRQQLVNLRRRLREQHPEARLHRARERLERASIELTAAALRRAEGARSRIARLAGRLDALSPLAVLERGYSIARAADGRVIRTHRDVAAGDDIEVWLRRGRIAARVTLTNAVGSLDQADEGNP